MNILFKVIAWVFAALFTISAVLQYNDPDSWVWILIWGLAAIISATAALNKISYSVPLIMGILCLVGFFYVYPDKFEGFEIGAGDIVNIERGREAFGLLIIAVTLLVLALRIKFFNRS